MRTCSTYRIPDLLVWLYPHLEFGVHSLRLLRLPHGERLVYLLRSIMTADTTL